MDKPFGFEGQEENEVFYLSLWRDFQAYLAYLHENDEEDNPLYEDSSLIDSDEEMLLTEEDLEDVAAEDEQPPLNLPENIRVRLIGQLESALVDDQGGLKWYVMTLYQAIPDLRVPEIIPPPEIINAIMDKGLGALNNFDLMRACFCPTIVAHLQIEIWRRVTPYWLRLYEVEEAHRGAIRLDLQN